MDSFISQIMLWPGRWVPEGWAKCDGSTLQISQYPALYSLIGNVYGGNPSHDFNLPKLEAPANMHYIIALEGIYPPRS